MPDPKPIQQRIEVLADTKGAEQVSRAMAELEARNKAEAQQVEKSTRAAQRKGQQLDRLRDSLRSLTAKEIEHERKVKAGEATDKQATQASQQRQQRVERLSRAIATQEDRQEELNRRVKESVGANRSQVKATDDSAAASENAAGKQGLLNSVLGAAKSQIAGLAVGFIGVNGLISLYDQWIERIDKASERLRENAKIARENAESRLDLVALRGIETEEQVNELNLIASFAGRRPGEVAQTLTLATSQLPDASEAEINELVLAAASLARRSTAPLPGLLAGVLPIFRETGDATQAANLFAAAIKEAGEADPGQLGQVIGENLKLNQAFAGTDTGETVGLIAAATGVGLDTRQAATALNAVNFALRGQGTPGGQETLERLDIDRSNVLVALEQLVDARERGDLSLPDIESLGGREAAGLFAILSDRSTFEDFVGKVQRVDAVEDFQGSLAQDAARSIFAPGSIQASNLLAKQFEVEEEGIRAGDKRAALIESYRTGLSTLLASELAKEGGGEFEITPDLEEAIKVRFEHFIGRGFEPDEAVRLAELTSRPNVLDNRGEPLGGQGRAGLFSDPLSVLIPQGVSDEPELLSDRAQQINDIIKRDIEAEFGRDIRLDRGLSPVQIARLKEIRALAVRPSLDLLPPEVQRSQEDVNRRDEELQREARERALQQSAAPDESLLDPIDQLSELSPSPAGINNYGTIYINGGDPLMDDLDGRDRLL